MPIQTRATIDATQNWFDTTKTPDDTANAVVDYYSASIGNFVNVQRRNHGAGIVQVSNHFQNFPGLRLQYENNQGMERLSMTVYPESAPQLGGQVIDTNNDGYIVWVHDQVGFPNPITTHGVAVDQIQSPYYVFLNEYLIYKGYGITQQAQAFVIMFGKTALRCHSIEDKQNPLADANNGGLVNEVIPARAQIDATPAPDKELIPKHKDLPGYFLFNWNDVQNPESLVLTGFIGTQPAYERWQPLNNGPFPPQINKGVHFFDPKKSPLKSDGQNLLTILYQPGGKPSAFEVTLVDDIFVEFFDRQKTRKVSQSWNYTTNDKTSTILANDTPLYWGCINYAPGGSTSTNMGFDLTKKAKKAENNFLLSGLDDYPGASLVKLVGLSDAQQQIITAYGVQCTAIIAAFNAMQAPIIAAALLQLAIAENTEANIQLFIGAYDNGTFSKTDNSQPTFSFEPFTPGGSGLTGNQLIDQHIAESGTLPGLWIVDQSEAAFWLTLQAGNSQQLDIIKVKTDTYTTAISAVPKLPDPPASAGKDIDAFKWRTVDVSGDNWTFGPWRGGT